MVKKNNGGRILPGLAHGLGRAFLGFIVQPGSGALDFFSLTVDGIGASCSRCLEVLNPKTSFQRIRNPRAIHADNMLGEYCKREAIGQVLEDGGLCSIWRPACPDGYVSVGDIARVGSHPPNVAAVYRNIDKLFTLPVGYDLVWRNCLDDYKMPVSIWHPRAPENYVAPDVLLYPVLQNQNPI
ncbi:hypothetical protein F0562_007950 [Nyssa sinensis]|uniref:Uncharacterized protein n=1 Tax=Nyssa sinensis TaxID=561372 RepID=A0A5J5A631_9ASTE|nr:hypothetical protein F0562_007950 [Nyssa sinensis]